MNAHVSPSSGWRRLLKRLVLGLLALLLVLALTVWLLLRASLPQLDGGITLPGLQAPLSLQRDALGTAVLQGQTRPDLARGLGFLHAQERFFEMDLTRRSAAGELAALFGAKALPRDQERRAHRLRARLSERLQQLPAADQALLQAYTEGVNAGLQALRMRPWQYLLLQAEPQAWQAVDSLLVAGEMFWMLQGQSVESGFELARLRERSGDALFDWLNPRGGPWDAALDGSQLPAPTLPSAELLDLRPQAGARPALAMPPLALRTPDEAGLVGSNNWAVSAARSKTGRAFLADDMHLALGVPSIWYRAQLELKSPESRRQLRAAGLTLPGLPALVVGSNGHVAWGFTNAYGQWFDWIQLPQDLSALRASGRLQSREERIAVKGGPAHVLRIEELDGAPLLREHQGRHYALRWIAHQGEAYNLELDRMMQARNVQQALQTAALSGIPHQNFLVADAQGQIAWSIAGRIWAQRTLTQSYARFQSPDLPAARWLAPQDYPRLLNPQDGQLWTANNRQLGGAMGDLIGDGGFGLGARAQQIRDRLREKTLHDRDSIAALHFDDEARFIQSWRDKLSPIVQASPAHAEVLRHMQQWNGRADVDQPGYLLIRTVRLRILDALWQAWSTPTLGPQQADDKQRFKWQAHFETSASLALAQRPAHLLPPAYASWDAFVLGQVDAAVQELTQNGRKPLAQAHWGQHNASRIQHVLSKAIPALSWFLDMPSLPQSGDSNLPHVAHPAFGQSQRLVVSPGQEDEGLLSMPGGQSGHPLSPYYGAGHAQWAAGQATPLLAGPARHQMDAAPASTLSAAR